MPLDPRTDLHTQPLPDSGVERTAVGYGTVTWSEEERTACEGWLQEHHTQIMTALQPVLQRFEAERNQFDGVMVGGDYPYVGAFRVNYPVTKRKVREVVNRAKQAFLDSDPIWAIDTDDARLRQPGEQVELALDRLVDNQLQAEEDLSQWIFEAGLHGTGFLSAGWLYHEEERQDVETYHGYDGQHAETLQDLFTFEDRYKTWTEEPEARRLHAQLARGQTVTRLVSYTQPTHNRPRLRWVPCASVRVYPTVAGAEGLRTTPAYGYVVTYTRAELEAFVDTEVLTRDDLNRLLQAQPTERPGPLDEAEAFDIWHATVRYAAPGDQDPVRYQVWYATKERILLRTRRYPWWCAEPDLIPLYLRQEEAGFFKPGLAADLRDDHVTLTVVFNLFLNAVDLANSMKFKTKKGSLAEAHILRRRWSPHVPLPWEYNPNEVEPMQVATAPLSYLVQGFELLRRQSDEQTGTTSLQSGRESPTDPSAPAAKTALLLQQVEPQLKEYFRSMAPGFRSAGQWLLWLYYQGVQLGWLDGVPGLSAEVTQQLPQLIPHLAPRALLLEFDRAGRAERNVSVLKLVAETFPGTPAVQQVAQIVIEQMDSQWARLAPTLDWTAPAPTAGAPASPAPGTQPAPVPGNGHSNSLQAQLGALTRGMLGGGR